MHERQFYTMDRKTETLKEIRWMNECCNLKCFKLFNGDISLIFSILIILLNISSCVSYKTTHDKTSDWIQIMLFLYKVMWGLAMQCKSVNIVWHSQIKECDIGARKQKRLTKALTPQWNVITCRSGPLEYVKLIYREKIDNLTLNTALENLPKVNSCFAAGLQNS